MNPAAPSPDPAEGPLAGLRVIEMGQLIAGPFCGQLMGDFGAEVIKLEPPGVGDPMRVWGRSKLDGRSLWWPVIGRNKKSVTLDLRTKDGQQVARELIATADIVVENFRPGVLEKWGLGYEALSAANPGLIMTRMSGYGQTGPYSDRTGFGSVGEAMGGLRHITGDADRPSARAGVSIGDSITATFGCMGALMALEARRRTGRGQVVDAALYESVLAMMENLVTEYDRTGYVRERSGPILTGIAPSNVYPCADGLSVVIGANADAIFRRLTEAMGRPEWGTDARYATHNARGERQEELDGLIAEWTAGLTSAQVLERMHAASIPAGMVYTAPEMLADPHFAARDAIVEMHDPALGPLKMQNVFPRLSANPGRVRWTGPELGAHTDAVLGDVLGYPGERIAELKRAGVV